MPPAALRIGKHILGGLRLYKRLKHYLPTMATGKLESPHFEKLKTSDLLRLERLFRKNGYEIRLVGGVVRDLLLGNNPKDIDIATDCTPETMIEMFEAEGIRYIPTGLQHGTVTVHSSSGDYEITTLRVDKVTDGRHAVVEFTKDWKTDSLRRDLTINSMSLTLDGTLYDYFEGQKHLAERRILFVGDANARIREDYLRILRYFRFYGRIVPEPDRHDPPTLQAIEENADGLRAISVERVWGEMSKILVGEHAPHLVTLMYQLKVAEAIGLPKDGCLLELAEVWRNMRIGGYHLQPESLLMTLIRTTNEANQLAQSWKLSNNERKLGIFITEHRARARCPDTPLKYFQDLIVDSSPQASVTELAYYCGKVRDAAVLKDWVVPVFPINGRDLQNAGFNKGPELGRLLNHLRLKWKESIFSLTKQELLSHATQYTYKNV